MRLRPATSTSSRCSTRASAKNWIAGRQLIDLIEHFPIALSAEQLRALTRPLAPRAYSIASSRREVGEEAHLLISAVRYDTHGRARKGVASNFVAERLEEGRAAARQGQAQQAFRPARARSRHHHGRPGHRRRAVPRLRAGAPRDRRDRPLTGCSSATAASPTISSISSNGRTRSKDESLTRMDVAFSRDSRRRSTSSTASGSSAAISSTGSTTARTSTSAATRRRWRRTCARRWCAPMPT